MLKTLAISGFTLFDEVDVEFVPGINVVIGSNATGKSHLLKLGYAACRWSHEMGTRLKGMGRPDKATLQKELGGKLQRVFRPDKLGRLTRRQQGRQRAEVDVVFDKRQKDLGFRFSFATNSTTDANLDKVPGEFVPDEVIFIPTKETLSLFPGFAKIYENYEVAIDETYYDLCRALDGPLLKGKRKEEAARLLIPIEDSIGGSIHVLNGRFYLRSKSGPGDFEVALVAEGYRKLGTLAYLIANGTLSRQSVIFWDEPETNLNPVYMRDLARVIVEVARGGTQFIIATHSLFLLREFALLLEEDENTLVTRRFMALGADEQGVQLKAGDSPEEIEPIAALEAEIEQSGRYLDSQWHAGVGQ